MSSLSIIEKQSLSVLEHLEYMIDLGHIIPLKKSGGKTKKYDVTFGDIDFKSLALPKLENLYGVSNYLKNNGVMFTIDFDLVNDHPAQEINQIIYDEDLVHLGSLEGSSIEAIKGSIVSLKHKILQSKENTVHSNKGVRTSPSINTGLSSIEKIEVLEDKTGEKRITIYVNANYEKQRNYRRGINWGLIYELAESQVVKYKKDFFDYFNSNKKNPLYSKNEYKITQILREEGDYIIPNIEIKIITTKAVSQRKLKSA